MKVKVNLELEEAPWIRLGRGEAEDPSVVQTGALTANLNQSLGFR